MAQMTTQRASSLDRLSKALNPKGKSTDEHVWGTVASVNADGSYQVRISASGETTRCVNGCSANAGDRVLVAILADGKCVVVARHGGTIGGSGGGGGTTPGKDGATFTPSVSDDGVISWTNNGGLSNPKPVNIKGPKGDDGSAGPAGSDGKDGKNGVSATHSWNGTVLTVTSASGTSSADLKGDKGDSGAQGYEVLYSNESGTTGTVTLSKSAANFSFLEVQYTDGSRTITRRVHNPNGKTMSLDRSVYGNGTFYTGAMIVSISGTSITRVVANCGIASFTADGLAVSPEAGHLPITTVIGFA